MTATHPPTITDVPGIRVGHWSDAQSLTGCTVIVPPYPNTAACDIRGAAPGTRETALLGPGMAVQQIDALVLTGGSAFGLAAADGVVQRLATAGRGHPTPAGPVPIVPAAVIFDLTVGEPVAPTAVDGAAAFDVAGTAPVVGGSVGAGMGATVGKWRGLVIPAGIGSHALRVGDFTVGALVVLNAVGDVFTLEGEALTGGSPAPDAPSPPPAPGANTTLVVVATDARLPRDLLSRLAVRAHDAMGACIRPAHTRYDGDVCFALSCGGIDGLAALDALSEASFVATARAIEHAAGGGSAGRP